MLEGHHEQQGGLEEFVRTQGGAHTSRSVCSLISASLYDFLLQVNHPHPPPCDAGGSKADGGCLLGKDFLVLVFSFSLVRIDKLI